MLCATAPVALATLQGERHEYQETLFGMIDEIFESTAVLFQRRLAEAQAAFDIAQAEQATREAAKAGAVEVVMAKKNEIIEKQQIVVQDASSVREAEAKVHEAEEARRSADASCQVLRIEQEKCQELIQGSLQVLKDGTWETPRVQKQKLAVVKSYAQKNLSLDKSALDSMSTVFGKKPEERGGFDGMVVDQLTRSLAKHLEALGEQRNSAAALMAEKATMAEQFGAAVKTSLEKQQESEAAVTAAETERTTLAAELADVQKAAKDSGKVAEQATADLACQKSLIERLQGDREAFAFLRARTPVPVPEPSQAAESMESKVALLPSAAVQTVVESAVTAPNINKMMEAPAAPPAAVTMVAAGA
jgi:hypothetical protein